MQRTITVILIISYVACNIMAQDQTSKADDNGCQGDFVPTSYKLAWQDEFNGEHLDLDKWFYRDGINRERTIMARENVIVEHGMLSLVCQVGDYMINPKHYPYYKGDKRNFKYRGAGVFSDWRFSDGYYEARSRLLLAHKWHPAFWLAGTRADENNGLKGGNGRNEIDIMECEPQRSTAQSIRVHDKVTGGEHRKLPPVEGETRMTTSSDQTKDWVIWGLELTHDQAKFYENGILLTTVDIPGNFVRDAMNIVLSCLTISEPTESGIQKFDWVRYYEPHALRNNPRKECEKLMQQNHLEEGYFLDLNDKEASNSYLQLARNALAGDKVCYRIYLKEAGNYLVKFGAQQDPEKGGKWQLEIDGKEHGDPVDLKGNKTYASWDVGEKRFPEEGYYEFTFTCLGSPGEKYSGAFDYIELVKL